jgi:hypothetical protein
MILWKCAKWIQEFPKKGFDEYANMLLSIEQQKMALRIAMH